MGRDRERERGGRGATRGRALKRYAPVWAVVLALSLGACEEGGAPGAAAGEADATPDPARGIGASEASTGAEPAPGLIAGTPEGGLAEWVAAIRSGLEGVAELAATDSSAALETVMNLYISRQEYIELYYGAERPLYAGEALDAAVEEAERRFHALMQLLQRQPAPMREEVAAAVEAVREQEAAVLETARASGAVLDPRSAPVASPASEGSP